MQALLRCSMAKMEEATITVSLLTTKKLKKILARTKSQIATNLLTLY
jgi:hypothetical protein